jgi:hypothetical protein
MQEMSVGVPSRVLARPTITDHEAAVIANEIALVLGTKMSTGAVKQMIPNIAQAVLRGAARYNQWQHEHKSQMPGGLE